MKKQGNWIVFCLLVCMIVLLAAYWGSWAVTTMVENTPIDRAHTIIIDAGHGGEDGGASSADGILESRYNLEIALRLEELFHFLGMETNMIRNTDISVYTEGETLAQKKRSDLKERVRRVNEAKNGLLLSIHQNSFPDSQYHGAQVFFAGTEGSQVLANALQTALNRSLNSQSNRNSKKAEGIYLMEHIQAPGVLIECGFLTNPAESRNLRKPECQKKLCGIIATTVCEYLSNN